MSHLVNIAYQGGTHGNFLRYVLDRFSSLTPKLEGLPFSDHGVSHESLSYSGKISRYHPNKTSPHFDRTDQPHILITVEPEDILLLERWATTRTENLDVMGDNIKLNSLFLESFNWQKRFLEVYNIDVSKESIPRFILRDFYKLSFLDIKKNGFITFDKLLRNTKPTNSYLFPVSSFWDKSKFLHELGKLDRKFSLGLDLSDLSVHDIFLSKLDHLKTRHRVLETIQNIKERIVTDTRELDTVEQAYLSAWIEKNHDFVTVPLTNTFFNTTGEILDWLDNYPQHYKAMNPNLPFFGNKPNPFHLWNSKK